MNKEKSIVAGAFYDPAPENPTTDNARVLLVDDGIVAYEHVSCMKVTLYATVDDFVKMWRVRRI